MIEPGPAFVLVLVALTAAASLTAWAAGFRLSRPILTAAVRAAAQLAAVSGVVVVVLRSWLAATAFVALMVTVATATSARRIGRHRSAIWAGLPIVAGVAPAFVLVLLSGSLPRTTVAVVPVLGIFIGGAMTATSLAGRRAVDALMARFGEYEAALSLGFSTRDAALLVCRSPAAEALLPALDQTRTVGLVALPGAFVGVLLGGGTPAQAGSAQLLVLIGLLAVETVAVVVAVELVARQVIRWNEPGSARHPTRL